jgi:hypothetical protein
MHDIRQITTILSRLVNNTIIVNVEEGLVEETFVGLWCPGVDAARAV